MEERSELERERVRATLVLGLMATIIGLRLFQTLPYEWLSKIFVVLLLYWALYAIGTAYGISVDIYGSKESMFCQGALAFGHLSFRFALTVTILTILFVALDGVSAFFATLAGWGVHLIQQWRFSLIGAIALSWHISMTFHELERISPPDRILPTLKEIRDYVRRKWVEWIETVLLASMLFMLDLLSPVTGP